MYTCRHYILTRASARARADPSVSAENKARKNISGESRASRPRKICGVRTDSCHDVCEILRTPRIPLATFSHCLNSPFSLFFSFLVDPQLSSWPCIMQRGGTWRKCSNIDTTEISEHFRVKIKRKQKFLSSRHRYGCHCHAYWCLNYFHLLNIDRFLALLMWIDE